ncbi:T9SS type A sorting domain-containing protein [Epilithonimonas caeni]|uniref:T9SS type A sorting domain-containing protein n=1 Tax=Epilithonimonas caeni TaxID=365343 RepID=UPI00040E278B|nr:T9SS type A sorting domain-containing protein [Epilithonimonas caeni]
MKKILQLLFSVCLFGFGTAQGLKPIAQKVADQKMAKRNFAKFSPFTKDVASKNAAVYNNEASDVTVMQLKTAELQRIVSEKPQVMELSFPFEGGDLTVELVKNDIFAGGFKVGTDKGDANYTPGVYYQGIIKGDNTSVVAFSFFDNDIVGVASTNELGNIVVGKAKSSQDFVSYSDYKLKSKNPFSCSAEELPENASKKISFDPNKKASRDSNNCVRIYFEVGYGPYTQNGSNVTSTSNWVTALFNNIKTLYDNESVKVAISEIYVWTSTDPYSGQPGVILNQFRTTRTTFNGDVAQLIRNPATTSVAYVNSICSVYKYSYCGVNSQNIAVPTYSWNIEAMTHELGHNFGSPHTHACAWNGNNTAIDGCGPASGNDEGCDGPLPTTTKGTIMSYCHLVGSVGISFANGFGQQPGDLIRETVASKACLGSDCITSCDLTITSLALNSVGNNTATATISDATGTTWKYRLTKTTDGTVVYSGNTTNKVLNFTGLDSNSIYRLEVGTDCSTTYQQNQIFITDGLWCGKSITDTGGESGNYSNNEIWTKTFYPDSPGQKVKITFTEFNLENGTDYITLRNGTATSPVFTGAARLTGTTIPASYESTHESGAVTITFRSDASGNNSGFKANFSCTVLAVDDVVNSKDVALYPNPVKNQFTLKGITKMKSVEVYDISGKLVKQFDADSLSKNTFDVSRLKTGNYVVQVKTENDSFSKKLIKQ